MKELIKVFCKFVFFKTFSFIRFVLLFIMVFRFALVASAEEAEHSEKVPHRIPRIDTEMKIDGYLDEEAWSRALKIDANIEVSPGENIPAPVETEVYMAYDNFNIYVAFVVKHNYIFSQMWPPVTR